MSTLNFSKMLPLALLCSAFVVNVVTVSGHRCVLGGIKTDMSTNFFKLKHLTYCETSLKGGPNICSADFAGSEQTTIMTYYYSNGDRPQFTLEIADDGWYEYTKGVKEETEGMIAAREGGCIIYIKCTGEKKFVMRMCQEPSHCKTESQGFKETMKKYTGEDESFKFKQDCPE